ncbi:helix-turn-helix domain-containing protein [Flavobacterium tegetincola]|uniref:helix-turn-helix domain-containing protein n=1 Tax=Flavobacterium tegetincola TaxID=150172 RepID=UPI00042249FB|nr:helix-turn-helix domain-containing protein [Flavobacterium tegetincola]
MFLNTKQVAEILGYTQRNVGYLIAKGKLKPINPNHKTSFLFTPEEVQSFNSKKRNDEKQ